MLYIEFFKIELKQRKTHRISYILMQYIQVPIIKEQSIVYILLNFVLSFGLNI